MQKTLFSTMFLALATLTAANAQSADPASQGAYPTQTVPQGAPVVRPHNNNYGSPRSAVAPIFDSQPAAGIYVRSDVQNGVQTVSTSATLTELRIVQGRADITVHHPANHSEILVDLPGGQVSLLKDGFYTFNAGTKTVRVLHGEAAAFEGSAADTKGTKVKETQELAFLGVPGKLKAVDSYPYELTADLLGGERNAAAYGDGPYGDGPYAAGFYGYGYPAPYYAYGYPGFYPYGGFGYPFGVGIGFGYYGGYRGGFGGYRGGFRR